MCSRCFANKSNLNRHVKALQQNHYTKTTYANNTCTEGVSTRSVGWGIQTSGGSGPFPENISIKENKDQDLDTSNDSDAESDTSNCFDADSVTSNDSDADSDTSNGSEADSDTSNGSDADSDTSNGSDAGGWGTRSDVWENVNNCMNSKGLTLK